MYLPEYFRESRLDILHPFMRRHSFATLISTGAELTASQLPVLLDPARGPSGTLRSHMAKLNPQWQTFREDADVLVIFQGPHAYISPTWYASQTKVPTWNYATVHAYGRPKIIDRPALHTILEDTVSTYESSFPSPWSLSRLPPDLVAKLEDAVVGFEIQITRLEGKWKLNQNHTPQDRLGAIAGLFERGDPASIDVATLMSKVE